MKTIKSLLTCVVVFALIIGMMPMYAVTVSADEPAEYPTICVDEQITVEITQENPEASFYFTPEEDGVYAFCSESDSDTDPRGYLLNDEEVVLEWDDDSNGAYDFYLKCDLTGGQTYIFRCDLYASTNGTLDVRLSKLLEAEAIQILDGETYTGVFPSSYYLTTAFLPTNAVEETETWESSDEDIVLVENNGRISLKKEGTAVVTVTTENGLTDSIVVTVEAPPSIQSDEEVVVTSGEAFFSFIPTENGTYVFYSYDNDFDTYGYLYDSQAVCLAENDDGGEGRNFRIEYELTAGEHYYFKGTPYDTFQGGEYKVQVARLCDATSIAIQYEATSDYVGEYLGFWTTFSPENSAEEAVEWNSDNTAVAVVDEYGEVELVGEGTATITVTSKNGLTDSVVVTAFARPVATELTIGYSTFAGGYVGDSLDLWVEFAPENCVEETIAWSSDNTDVAVVDEYGEVEFVGEGTATITATSENGLTDSVVVTGKAIPSITVDEEKTPDTNIDGGIGMFSFVPSVSGVYAFYSYSSDYDTYGYLLDANRQALCSDDDGGEGLNFRIEYELVAGETYYLRSKPLGSQSSGMYRVTVVRLFPATSMTLNVGDTYTGYIHTSFRIEAVFTPENAITESVVWTSDNPTVASVEDGYVELLTAGKATISATSESGLSASCVVTVQDYPTLSEGETASVSLGEGIYKAYFYFTPEETSYYSFYSSGEYDSYGWLLNEDHSVIKQNDDDGDEANFKIRHWMEAGTTYVLCAGLYYSDHSAFYEVTVEASPYVADLEVLSIPTKTQYIEGFVNDYLQFDGLELKAVWSDGSTTEWTYNDSWEIGESYIEIDASEVEINGIITLTCDEAQVDFSVIVIENPVDHLELVSGTSYEYIENINGWTAENENGEFFYYETHYPYDAVIRIVYTDGTSCTANVEDDVDGYLVWWDSNQYETPWVVGTQNASVVSYLGHEVVLPITVVENPVDHLELVSGTSYEYVENADGWTAENENGEFFYYETVYPYDAVIRIVYTDGTSCTANVGDYVEQYRVWWDSNQYETPWVLGTQNTSVVSYLGHEVVLPITVKENPVDHLELVSGTSYEYVENADGWTAENENGEFFYYETVYPYDAVIRIVYTDGTSCTANVGDYVEQYRVWWDSNQYETPWVLGTQNTSVVSYLGHEVVLPITVKENPVDRIAITSAPTREYVFGDPYYGELYPDGSYRLYPTDMQGICLTVYYKDGTSDIFTYEDFSQFDGTVNGHYYYLEYTGFFTKPGDVHVTFEYMGKTAEYTVVLKPAEGFECGDVTGDGIINAADASELFYYINSVTALSEDKLQRADLNENGVVNLYDAARLFYLVNGLI